MNQPEVQINGLIEGKDYKWNSDERILYPITTATYRAINAATADSAWPFKAEVSTATPPESHADNFSIQINEKDADLDYVNLILQVYSTRTDEYDPLHFYYELQEATRRS